MKAFIFAAALLSQCALGQQLKWEKNLFQRQVNTSDPGAAGAGGAGGANTAITVNGNGNTVLSNSIVNSFNGNQINYYSAGPDAYYAKLCATCAIVKVSKSNNTYAQQACPVCPIEYFHCPGYSMQSSKTVANGTAAYCNYQAPICLTCKNVSPAPPAPAPPVTTVKYSSAVLTVPVTVASSVAAVASASGAAAASAYASSVVAAAAVATVTATVASPPASTVVNVPCNSCPAGSAATTVAQVPVSPVPVSNVSSPAAPPAAFKGAATTFVAPVLSVLLGLTVSLLL